MVVHITAPSWHGDAESRLSRDSEKYLGDVTGKVKERTSMKKQAW